MYSEARKIYQQTYYKKNKESINKRNREYYGNNKDKILDKHRRYRYRKGAFEYNLNKFYGISVEYYANMRYVQQGNKCPICLCGFEDVGGLRAVVDHCHRTGNVRGILCTTCNSGIGMLKECPDVISRIVGYLK